MISGGVYKFCDFRPISVYTWQAIQDRAIVTIEQLREIICVLSNCDISDDLERSFQW